MDEKRGDAQTMGYSRCSARRVRLPITLAAVGFCLLFLYQIRPLAYHTYHLPDCLSMQSVSTAQTGHELVPLEAHIMSKCPDAKDCLREMVLPAMQRVYDKVNFTLSFIGKPTDYDDGVDCKHGPEECLGNIVELCAQQLYPDPKIYLGFVMCLTRNYEEIPERGLIEDCALEHAVDFDKLSDCTGKDNGAFGVGLLRDSVRRTSEAGVSKSCTVRLNEEIYCIRDDGEWKDCPSGPAVNDLVIAVEKLYRSS